MKATDVRSGGLWHGAGWAWLVATLVITLRPGLPEPNLATGLCLICGGRGGADAVLNALWFVPLGGFFYRLGRRNAAIALVLTVLLTMGIEGAQWLFLPNRHPSLGDVVFNFLGGGLGTVVASAGLPSQWGSVSARRVLNVAAGVFFLGTVFATGSLLRPSWPGFPWVVHWQPDFGGLERFQGRLLEATANGHPMPSGVLNDTTVFDRAPPDRVAIELRFVAGPSVNGIAPVVAVFDSHVREVFLIGVDRQDLAIRMMTQGVRARLEAPTLYYPGVADWEPGEVVELEVRFSPNELSACFVVAEGGSEVCSDQFGPADGWMVLAGSMVGRGRGSAPMGWLWLVGLAAVTGVLITSRQGWVWGIVSILAGLLLMPAWVGLGAATAWDVIASLGGLALGARIGRGSGALTTVGRN